jgi:hypothetical protein
MAPFVVMSLYMEQMSQSIGSTVGMLAITMSISTAGAVTASLTIGRALKVMNHRIMIGLAGVLVFAFQFTISVSRGIVPIYMVAFLNGFGTTWGGMAVSRIIITHPRVLLVIFL